MVASALLVERYALGEVIAAGGGSLIHRAEDRRLQHTVAVKVPRTPEAAALVRHEARVLTTLSRSDVVSLLDAGEEDERPFLVMEHLDGPNLRQALAGDVADTAGAERVAWAVAAARAVAGVHEAGWVHGDVKPSHIVLGAGRVTLVDFGLARRASSAPAAPAGGTPAYLAPEVRASKVHGGVTAAADVYALGVTFRELLSGIQRFEGLVAAMTSDVPEQRPAATEVAQHLARAP